MNASHLPPGGVIGPCDDAAGMAALHRDGFPDEPWAATAFTDMLTTAGTRAFGLAAADGGLTGFVLLRTLFEDSEIISIAVAPTSRGRGIGRRLLAAALTAARQDGATAMFLEVAADNPPALALYRQAGFIEAGRRRGYYRRGDGDPVDALVMRCSLIDIAGNSFAYP